MPMDGDRVTLEPAGPGIAVMRFSNPPTGLMDDGTEAGFVQALDRIDGTPGLRAVVLTGTQPGVFIRHYDVAQLEARGRAMAARGLAFSPARPVPESPIHACLRRMEASDRVFIAAINGIAMGGGFETALACDLRIAARGDYPIGLPEANIGLLPGAGGTQRLTRLIGAGRAMQLMLLGRTLAPDAALAAGLVHEVVDGDALPRALELAAAIAAQLPKPVAHIKRLVHAAGRMPDEAALALERTLFCDLMVDADGIEAMARMNRGERDIHGNDL